MNKQKLHNCQRCKRKFLNLPSLKIHTKYFHKNPNQIKINTEAKKPLGNGLLTGAKSEKSKPSKCKFCSKILSNKYTLRIHMATVHEKKTKFQCHICNKFVSHSRSLTDHIQSVHEKLKPHRCSFCAKSFSQQSNLKSHIDMVHNNLKQHICPICNRGFGQNSTLKKHIECVHEKIKVDYYIEKLM